MNKPLKFHYKTIEPPACDYYGHRYAGKATIYSVPEIERTTCLHCLKAIQRDRAFTKEARQRALMQWRKIWMKDSPKTYGA